MGPTINKLVVQTNTHHNLSHRVFVDSVDFRWKAPHCCFYGIAHMLYVNFVAWSPPTSLLETLDEYFVV